jgi:polyphosphate glucokinase
MKYKEILGIDFGGSGIKGAPVDAKNGILLEDRYRVPTPDPATPEAVAEVIKQIAEYFKWKDPIGVGFPAVVQNGEIKTAANIDNSWIGVNAQHLFTRAVKLPVYVVNDADAAGLATLRFGDIKGAKGVVLMLTIGTGIGTALFTKGQLFPNTELGHLILNGYDAETYASDAVRKNENLDWPEWGKRLNEYLQEMERLFWPDLVIIGGGVSKKIDKFIDQFTIKAKVVATDLLNEAGIIGAAAITRENRKQLKKWFDKF